jgi:phosphoribosylamine--glycine ligase
LLYKGSVKDIYNSETEGELIFTYSDRYSIFDWGEMPDAIENKGRALAAMARLFFKHLGVTSHFLRDEIGADMRVKKVDVLRPRPANGHFDYSDYQKKPVDTLVPLEIIFRFGAPEGSSFLTKNWDTSALSAYGLESAPVKGERFPRPIVEFTTKLEPGDRPLSRQEAQQISGLNDTEFASLQLFTTDIAHRLLKIFAIAGVELWDGKIEVATIAGSVTPDRQFMLVDSIGPDELRLSYDGYELSKECLRAHYRESSWYKELSRAKSVDPKKFKDHCKQVPEKLPMALASWVSGLYQALANALALAVNEDIPFAQAPTLSEIAANHPSRKINIAVLGSGGREHAMAQRLSESKSCSSLIVCTGNPGMQSAGLECLALPEGSWSKVPALLKTKGINLVVVGPETLLEAGMADQLRELGISVLGPSQRAAQLESSKAFAKDFMERHKIPTAKFHTYHNSSTAIAELENGRWDMVRGIAVKASSLAGGKGVVVTDDLATAKTTLVDFFDNPNCSVKTEQVVIEERLIGVEISCFALCDGERFLYLGHACDHKRLGDGDVGPNTGGMGGHTPEGWPSPELVKKIETDIIAPTLSGMKKEGNPFVGFLFVGLMIEEGNIPKVIEYNCRFGDPEAQILFPLIEGDIADVFCKTARGELGGQKSLSLSNKKSVHIVMTAKGYPSLHAHEKIETGKRLNLADILPESCQIFFSGVSENGERELVTSGGRVLGVTALGDDLQQARELAYSAIEMVSFSGAHYRRDIGTR